MNLYFFCPIWGSEHLEFEAFCEKIKTAGYDGVELSLPMNDEMGTLYILEMLKKYDLKLCAQHWETIAPNLNEHMELYRQRLEWQASAKPLFINSQTGRDWFSIEDNMQVIAIAKDVSDTSGVKIVHETHRGKFSFCAAQTRKFIEADPDLRLTADFSHWCNVSESLLEDQSESVAVAIDRADHFHARVGHSQGPQVNDPRAPEWSDALNAHLNWWDAIYKARSEDGSKFLTITPEFGPWPYMPELAYTRQPLADQWDINEHMMNLLKERYSK